MSAEVDYSLLYCAAGSFAVGGLCYYFYSNGYYLTEMLDEVPRYEATEQLINDVKNNRGFIPYAAVSGLAKADDREMYGLHNKTSKGLIRHTYVVEHTRSEQKKTQTWSKDTRNLSSLWSVEPFSLCSSQSRIRVSVRNPLDANDLKLSTVYDHYEPVASNIADKVFDFLTGHQVVGVRTVEKMLLPETKLTAIGQIILHDGQLHVEAPENGLKYFLTKDSIDSLVKSEMSSTFAKKVVSYVFLTIGGILCSIFLYKTYLRYKAELEYNRLERENSSSADDNSCLICLSEPKNLVLIPCGHVCVCKICIKNLSKCPICRKDIERVVPIFKC